MSFSVEPADLRVFATTLQHAYADADAAKTYVHAHGSFSFHESGIIGALSGAHSEWMGKLDEMLTHLQALTDSSSRAISDIATQYKSSDEDSAARVDASYPAEPRPPVNRD
ncbi:hypothetical protein [Actinoplanes sp. NPDC026623]|uniref:hypothetical protein n=1 Tax=Actinoplanes sp. NPDC026623 TaxID=3155610 RepID=UPI0033D7758F